MVNCKRLGEGFASVINQVDTKTPRLQTKAALVQREDTGQPVFETSPVHCELLVGCHSMSVCTVCVVAQDGRC